MKRRAIDDTQYFASQTKATAAAKESTVLKAKAIWKLKAILVSTLFFGEMRYQRA